MGEICVALSALATVVVFYLWMRWRYIAPLKGIISLLDVGGKERVSPKTGAPLIRQLGKRCLDYEQIVHLQQNELERSQQSSDLLLDSLELFVGFFSTHFVPRYINRYGRGRLDIMGRSLDDVRLVSQLEPDFLRRLWKHLLRHGHITGMEGRISLPHEGERDIKVSIYPVGQEGRDEKGFLVLAEDVSRQRRVELNLQNQISLSQHIFDTIPEFILVVDPNLTVLFANGSVMRFTGVEKIIGRHITTILSVQSQADGFDEYLRNSIKNQQPVNRINILNPFGAGSNYVDLLVKPLHRGKRQIGALILIRDVSEWRDLTEEIRSLQSFNDKVINSSPYALISIDGQDRIRVWNQSAESLFHLKGQDAIGQDLYEIVAPLVPLRDVITEVKIIGRAQYQGEKELIVHGGTRLVNINYYPIFNNGTNVVISIEDITTMRALQRSLSEAQKMGALGMLTRGIVHDLNNMLTGIVGRTSILKKKIPKDSDLQKDVQIIGQSGERVSELIGRIHQFSKQRLDRAKPVSLGQVVIQTLDLLRPNLQGIKIDVDELEGELNVLIDQTKISQIVVNLVVNAKDAMKESRKPHLLVRLSGREISGHDQIMDGEYAELTIHDNGSGISPENLDKIFQPFFTTKISSHGTGIGLATVKTLIHEANGLIEVKSTPGVETEFTILLPRTGLTPDAVTDASLDVTESPYPPLSGAVLLIDDEAVVREIGAEMLETLEVEVLMACDGEQGLGLYQENRDRISLILLDVEMPGLGGEQVYKRLLEQGCACPIVIASGYNRDYLERQVFAHRLEHYLAKPFQLAQLSSLIKELSESGAFAQTGEKQDGP